VYLGPSRPWAAPTSGKPSAAVSRLALRPCRRMSCYRIPQSTRARVRASRALEEAGAAAARTRPTSTGASGCAAFRRRIQTASGCAAFWRRYLLSRVRLHGIGGKPSPNVAPLPRPAGRPPRWLGRTVPWSRLPGATPQGPGQISARDALAVADASGMRLTTLTPKQGRLVVKAVRGWFPVPSASSRIVP
jgi:hypothetical protein